jgi:hypothetical protein
MAGSPYDPFHIATYAMLRHPNGVLTVFSQGVCIDLIPSDRPQARLDVASLSRATWLTVNDGMGGILPVSLYVDPSGSIYGQWHETMVQAPPLPPVVTSEGDLPPHPLGGTPRFGNLLNAIKNRS